MRKVHLNSSVAGGIGLSFCKLSSDVRVFYRLGKTGNRRIEIFYSKCLRKELVMLEEGGDFGGP